jgi:hypothetical protein
MDLGVARPPMRWGVIASFAVTVIGTAVLFLAISHAAPNFNDLVVGGLIFGAGALIALIRAFMATDGRAHLVVVVACALALVAGDYTGAPMQTRWKFSEPAFENVVARSPADIKAPFRAGLYEVEQVDASADGYLFYDSADDLSDTGDGIAYLPRGNRGAFPDQDAFIHLDGPWYAWVGNS